MRITPFLLHLLIAFLLVNLTGYFLGIFPPSLSPLTLVTLLFWFIVSTSLGHLIGKKK